jgi:hypothetical protein
MSLTQGDVGNMLPGKFSAMPARSKPATAVAKMREYRARLREQGLRPVQVWVPDIHAPGFKAEIRRQLARLDPVDEAETLAFIEAVAEEPPR